MSFLNLFLLCLQACLIRNVYSQCFSAALPNPYGYEAGFAAAAALAPGFATPGAYGFGIAPGTVTEFPAEIEMGAYGGAGIGNVAVAGEMLVAGTTLVTGQVPILGSVRFVGDLPAAGTVSISGSCGCGGGAYIY